MYRSPSASEATFLDFFEQWCDSYVTEQEVNIIIVGDFNINVNKEYTYSIRLRNCLSNYGLKQHITDYTHITPQGRQTLIDLVITNYCSNFKCSVMSQQIFNNHSLIEIILENKNKLSRVITIREKLTDIENFKHLIKNIKFDFRNINSLDDKYDKFSSAIVEVMNQTIPKKEIKVKGKGNPWFDMELMNSMKIRDQKFKTFRLTKNITDWEVYRLSRNSTVTMMRMKKKTYYETAVDKNKHDSKIMWKTLKQIVSGKSGETYNELEFEDGVCTDLVTTTKKFNEYYINSIQNIVDSIHVNKNVIDTKVTLNNYKFNDFAIVDESVLKDVLFSLPNKSSPDEIPANILKTIFEEIKYPLLNIINLSLETGEIPKNMKLSTVVPLRKISGTKKVEQFRPVNMLPTTAKILEKIVYCQLLNYVEMNNIFYEYQSGFRKNYNCETAFQYILNEWKEKSDNNMFTVVVFLDLKRAFETINREKLIKKLENYGLSGIVLKWFYNYLRHREQRVKCGETISGNLTVEHGVPQGSILGPLLFMLYINNICESLKHCKIHLFADDAVLYFSGNNLEDINKCINDDLKNVANWLQDNALKLNLDKTNAMLISEKPRTAAEMNDFKIKIEGVEIKIIDKVKYLGIIINSNLKFGDHIDYICKKISKKLGILKRSSVYLSTWSTKTVYNTIILPHFNFSSTILYLSNVQQIQRLQKLQNRAMRIILKLSRYTSIKQMLMQLNWLPIKEMLELNSLIFIHKIKSGLMPAYFNGMMRSFNEIHNYNTRNKDSFTLNHKNSKKAQNSIFFKGLIAYNKLPANVRGIVSIKNFKSRVKSLYLDEKRQQP